MDYSIVFNEALSHVLEDYSENKIHLLSESDLQAHLFYECRKLLEKQGFQFPLKLYAEKTVFDRPVKVDLVLGDNEVLVEFKFEPDYPGVSKPVVFTTKKEAAGSGSVEADLEKIDDYARKGKCAHFVMIDEDGRHARRIVSGMWRTVSIGKKPAYYLHIEKMNKKRTFSR